MSEGATISARPNVRQGGLAKAEETVVINLITVYYSAVPVRGVFAQAHIGYTESEG
jgi:hypothetical protein